MPEVAYAELFSDGGGQAVRLPPGFELEGERVRVRRSGRSVILEPAGSEPATPDAAALFAEVDAQGGLDVFEAAVVADRDDRSRG